ncbi:MAG TPA: SPFH domain-containing protein [Polyangiaceae bacterium]|nr:SPFH domain-containing protein [Polyangiaceae bacterium]
MNFLIAVAVAFIGCFLVVPFILFWVKALGLYVIVRERECLVFELFGKVRLTLREPGLHSPWSEIGPLAALVPLFGRVRRVDLRLDQSYLRSQPVNSEEGAPMGIGVWCEMFVSDPLAYLYKNVDPVGSLRANVSNAAVRCLSNLKLNEMLENRHAMSHAVREEVSVKSKEWGYMLGSTYIRKVHFRDRNMIAQIEQKVVNRLRQVTAAIQQDGSNRVNVIRSTADREAAVEFAKAATTRPRIVGAALGEIAKDATISSALFELLETQKLLQSEALEVNVVPSGVQVIAAVGGASGVLGPR